MNKTIIIGNLTKDPELRMTQQNVAVCTFTVAVNGRRKSNGESDVQYFRVAAWRQLGENCAKYLAKGRKVFVSGAISLREYDSADGQHRSNMEINAEDVEFLSSREDTASTAQGYNQASGFQQVDAEDEVPF